VYCYDWLVVWLPLTEWYLFACLISQRFIRTNSKLGFERLISFTKQSWKKMSEEERQEFLDYYHGVQARMLETMKSLPKGMLLTFRYLQRVWKMGFPYCRLRVNVVYRNITNTSN
jgi:hypothetical protein